MQQRLLRHKPFMQQRCLHYLPFVSSCSRQRRRFARTFLELLGAASLAMPGKTVEAQCWWCKECPLSEECSGASWKKTRSCLSWKGDEHRSLLTERLQGARCTAAGVLARTEEDDGF